MLSEEYNPATNLILNLFLVTDSLLTECSEKMKYGGMEKEADCLGMKWRGSMLDLTEEDCSCERKKEVLFQFFPKEKF